MGSRASPSILIKGFILVFVLLPAMVDGFKGFKRFKRFKRFKGGKESF